MWELVEHYEFRDQKANVFKHTITVWKEDDNYYQFKHFTRQDSVDLDSLPASAPGPLPLKFFMGRWNFSLTEAPRPPPVLSFLKRPRILLVADNDDVAKATKQDSPNFRTPRDNMITEAKIYETLKQNPHPNICVYYGCVRDGDYFTALCLKEYGRSLQHAVWKKDRTLDAAVVLDGISQGLNFLHKTLGLVHNDINPSNIMLDDAGKAVIIDFDSCMRIGEEIGSRKAGTFGWQTEPPPVIALPENDMHGLTLIAKFIGEGLQ